LLVLLLTASFQELADLYFCGKYLLQNTNNLEGESAFDDQHALIMIDKFLRKYGNSPNALHLKALFSEKLGLGALAVEAVTLCSTILEEAYEVSEDSEIAWRYCLAEATLGRLKLNLEHYNESIGAFEMISNLLPEPQDEVSRKTSIQASLGLGISFARQGSMSRALEAIEKVFTLAGYVGFFQDTANIIKAQVAWHFGNLDLAKFQLLNRSVCSTILVIKLRFSTSDRLVSLPVVTTLAALGISSKDRFLVEAALEEVQDQQCDHRYEGEIFGMIPHLLSLYELSKVRSIATVEKKSRSNNN
jgi:tetratricopeptide (TPR) repeat protein